MKKDTILGFIAFVLLVFAIRSIAYDSSSYDYKERTDINCVECCSKGRAVGSACSNKCGGCQIYNDSAFAENHDYPPNDDVQEDY